MPATIGIVIVTKNRPAEVLDALHSVMNQTKKADEIVVVIDGFDATTENVLQGIENVKVIKYYHSVGASGARTTGALSLSTEWICFLDDDDLFINNKIEVISQAIDESGADIDFIFSRYYRYDGKRMKIIPYTNFNGEYPMAEYLFARPKFSKNDRQIQTSSIAVRRSVYLAAPFRRIPKHQDWDWLISATNNKEKRVKYISSPLAVWRDIEESKSLGKSINPQFSLEFINYVRDNYGISKKSYGDFLLCVVATQYFKSYKFSLGFSFWIKGAASFPNFASHIVCIGVAIRSVKKRFSI